MTAEELRKLDAEIHQKVMGRRCEFDVAGDLEWFDTEPENEGWAVEVPRYSTDIAAAWQVVKKLSEMPCCRGVEIENAATQCGAWGCTVRWKDEVTFVLVPAYETLSETAPLAICKAALKALEAKS